MTPKAPPIPPAPTPSPAEAAGDGPLFPDTLRRVVEAILVEELPASLRYHGLVHTRRLVRVATELSRAEGLGETERRRVETAALLLDTGYRESTSEPLGKSALMANLLLPVQGYPLGEVDAVRRLIERAADPADPDNPPETPEERVLLDVVHAFAGEEDAEEQFAMLYREQMEDGRFADRAGFLRHWIPRLKAIEYHSASGRERFADNTLRLRMRLERELAELRFD